MTTPPLKPGDRVIVVGTFTRNEVGNLDVDFGPAIGSLYMGESGDSDVPQILYPLDDATVERLARAAYEAFWRDAGIETAWDDPRRREHSRENWRRTVRAVIAALVEGEQG